jgi:hypothetical protein
VVKKLEKENTAPKIASQPPKNKFKMRRMKNGICK